MYKYSEVNSVHLEITDLCNARCPQCPRNIMGGADNPYLKGSQLYLDDIKKILKPEFIKQLRSLYMCGNFGDPGVARDTREIFQHLRDTNPTMSLSMHTNGSMRTQEWWSSLPKILGKNHHIVFGIDGLEDTNHIYRQGTNWKKIIENVKSFIDAGGNAKWHYIVFKHNEHQVEKAAKLAKEMKFVEFLIKKTGRFYNQFSIDACRGVQAVDIKGNNTNLIEMPENSKYQNEMIFKILNDNNAKIREVNKKISGLKNERYEEYWIKQKITNKFFGYESYNLDFDKKNSTEKNLDKVEIKCRVLSERSIFISSEGYVIPCCWIGSDMYSPYRAFKGSQVWDAINEVGINKLDIKINDLETIINGKFFQETIPNRWKQKSCAEGKLAVCAKTCGLNRNVYDATFSGQSKTLRTDLTDEERFFKK